MSRRLANIQSANHELVQLLGVICFTSGHYPTNDAEDRERELHIEFEYLARFKANTRGAEWFSASPALLNKIQEVSQLPDILGLPRTVGFRMERNSGEA